MTPLYETLQAELHARPHPVLTGRFATALVARMGGDRATIDACCQALMMTHGWQQRADVDQYRLYINGEVQVRVEQHQEFVTYAVFAPTEPTAFSTNAWECLPAGWAATLPGESMVRLRLHVAPADVRPLTRDDLEPIFGDQQFLAASVSDGKAAVWTDYRLDADGWGLILVQDFGLSPRRCGRLIQRLHDLETYRQMALVGLPLARDLSPQLDELEQRLTSEIAALGQTPAADDHVQLSRFTALAIAAEHLRARAAQRLRGTQAYADIVTERLDELRQHKIAGFQTLSEFLGRRMNPALRLCVSVQERLEELSVRIDRATDLLRTRVDTQLEAQNQAVLASMDRRAALQLRLQQTVEGLSVVVLTYYIVGLLKYLMVGAKSAGLHVDSDLLAAIAVPVVAIAVWASIRIIQRRMHQH